MKPCLNQQVKHVKFKTVLIIFTSFFCTTVHNPI